MKIKILICLILSCLIGFSLFSQETGNRETQQVALVAQILKNSSTQQMQKVWPKYNLRSKPIFITFGNGHIYAFNIKLSERDWKKTNVNGVEVFYTSKDLWGITATPMKFDFVMNGQESFVFRLDMMPEPAFLPFFVLVHERFHVYQMQHFASERLDVETEYSESENVENLSYMQLEELVLLDFMKALSENSKDEALKHLKTFIGINKERRQLLDQRAITWEARQQMVEGLADYAAAKNLDVFAYFGDRVGQKHILHTMQSYTQDEDITERALKWRHYGVGASIAYALDFLQVPNWKPAVEQNISLQSLLEKHLKVSKAEEQALVEQAIEKYRFHDLKQVIKQRVEAYRHMLTVHQQNFKNLPGITIKLQSPPNTGLSAGGYSKGVYSLSDGSMFSIADTSKTASEDNNWTLELRSMPYLFQTNNGFRQFKMDKDNLELLIDGQRCSPNQLGERPFNYLTIKGKECSFHSKNNPGTVRYKNGEISITYL